MGNKLLSVLKKKGPAIEDNDNPEYSDEKDGHQGTQIVSKWKVLKSHVVTESKQSASLKTFLHQQNKRKMLLKKVHVEHHPTKIALEPLGFSDRRKSTNTKLLLEELARFHKQGVEHARGGKLYYRCIIIKYKLFY